MLSVSTLHKACTFPNRVMVSRRESGQFQKTADSTTNWYLYFADGEMNARNEEEIVWAGPTANPKNQTFAGSKWAALIQPTKSRSQFTSPQCTFKHYSEWRPQVVQQVSWPRTRRVTIEAHNWRSCHGVQWNQTGGLSPAPSSSVTAVPHDRAVSSRVRALL